MDAKDAERVLAHVDAWDAFHIQYAETGIRPVYLPFDNPLPVQIVDALRTTLAELKRVESEYAILTCATKNWRTRAEQAEAKVAAYERAVSEHRGHGRMDRLITNRVNELLKREGG